MSDEQAQPIGDILDKLGVRATLESGDMIAGAVVIAKVVDEEGKVSIILQTDEAATWLDELALVTAAHGLVNEKHWQQRGEGEG